jgi:hypothetical protein
MNRFCINNMLVVALVLFGVSVGWSGSAMITAVQQERHIRQIEWYAKTPAPDTLDNGEIIVYGSK